MKTFREDLFHDEECVKVELSSGLEYWRRGLVNLSTIISLVLALAVVELTIFAALQVDRRLAREIVVGSTIFPMVAALGCDMFSILDYVKKIRGYHHFTYKHYVKRVVKIAAVLYISGQIILLSGLMLKGKDPLYPIVFISLFSFFLLNLWVITRRYISWARFVWGSYPLSDYIDVHREVCMCMARRNRQGLLWMYICWLTFGFFNGTYRETKVMLYCGFSQCSFYLFLLRFIVFGMVLPVAYLVASYAGFLWPG